MHEAEWFIGIGALFAVCVGLAIVTARVSIPFLVAFLGVGVLLGDEGLGLVRIHEVELVRVIGVAGLSIILFEGGLSTSFRRLREVVVPAILLSTIGIAVTTLLAGIAGHWLFGLSWLESFLLGAVVSSTDAAAVFATLRSTPLKRNLARTLEAESGLNDPMAIALTIGMATWILQPDYNATNLLWLILRQLGIGLLCGAVLGRAAMAIFSYLPRSVGSFAPVASLAACALTYGITDLLGGSGFMAVYLVGLAIGSTPSRYRSQLTMFHEGAAFVVQVILFTILGLFVAPTQLGSIALGAVLFTLALLLFIRPVAVWASTIFLPFSHAHRLLIGWAGLRGAVPIVMATLALSEGVPRAQLIFNIVFFVVAFSVVVQGVTLRFVAQKLDGLEPHHDDQPSATTSETRRFAFVIQSAHAIAGVQLREIGLPPWARVAVVSRKGKHLNLSRELTLEAGDKLTIVCPTSHEDRLEDVMVRWRRRL
jgi:cell volume regulation protein A